ncbi:MAG: zinc ribbon domain-containing protein [Thermoplasmata archaeon YP2-bin.285]|uniref:Zinc ribbon domain-containing protein n=2 Tax=Candidatus Sysuiplasma superficiale TaxID=2823368 RepID=A0A8J7YLS1_9ARCH|nr:zinc ribbon domain-containing protein [Candidatus Sysuiplasma superficiale]
MAKKVCPNCGYSNKAKATVCSNCGYYLLDDQFSSRRNEIQAPSTSYNPAVQPYQAASASQTVSQANAGMDGSRVIMVHTKGGIYRWLPTIASFIPLAIFIALESVIALPAYSFIIFIVAIFVLSPLARRLTGGVQFYARGFRLMDNGRPEIFDYRNIESAKVDSKTPGLHSVTLSFRNGEKPLTIDFDSMSSFRTMLMQLSRRRIPLSEK